MNQVETKNGNLVVKREVLKTRNGAEMTSKRGNICYAYKTEGIVRDRKSVVNFVPKDKGGYGPLDIVFDSQDNAELIVREEQIAQQDGRKSTFITYMVRNVDEDGIVYECTVRPARDSDKSLLAMLLNVVKAENIQAAE